MTLRILVVDDDLSIRALVARVLSTAGYEVESVPDAPSALQAARGDQPFSVVVTNQRVGSAEADPMAPIRRRYGAVPVLHLSPPRADAVTPEYSRRSGDGSQAFRAFDPDELIRRVREIVGDADGRLPQHPRGV